MEFESASPSHKPGDTFNTNVHFGEVASTELRGGMRKGYTTSPVPFAPGRYFVVFTLTIRAANPQIKPMP